MHLLSWWQHILFPQIFLLIRFLSFFCLFSVYIFYRNFCTNGITTKMQLYFVEKNCFPIACSFTVSNGTKKNNKSTKQATTYPDNRSELNLPLLIRMSRETSCYISCWTVHTKVCVPTNCFSPQGKELCISNKLPTWKYISRSIFLSASTIYLRSRLETTAHGIRDVETASNHSLSPSMGSLSWGKKC